MNPILLQKQLKENANDLQDFCKDLRSWGEEMKRKEDSIKKKENDLKKTKIQTTGKTTEKIKETPKAKLSKTGSTDYNKWEKYDADLECERLEDDVKDDSELTDEFEESVRDEALVYKEKGNSYVKNKDWDKAIEFYTKAIKCYSYDPVFYANRALCHLKKQSFVDAENDCTMSLKLDSTYVKALQRRAAARESLGKLEHAKIDLELVLTHEPKNKESIAALENIKKKVGSTEKVDEDWPMSKFAASRTKLQSTKPIILNTTPETVLDKPKIDTSAPSTSNWPDPGFEIISVRAIDKPAHLRSKKPLKRIEITEADSFLEASEKTQLADNQAIKKHTTENVKKVSFQENDKTVSEPAEITSVFKKKREQIKNKHNEQLSQEAWPKSNLQNSTLRSDDLKIVEKHVLENTVKDVKNNENLFITKMDNNTINDIKSLTTKVEEFTNEFSVPKTSVQFYATWKNLKTPNDKYKYLKLIDPVEISNLFQESLESNVFSNILEILSTQFIENEDNVYKFLNGLTEVKRFSTLTMFMDSTDKNRLWKIITYLREHEKLLKEDVDALILKYEL